MPTPLRNQASITYEYQGSASLGSADSNVTVTYLLDPYAMSAVKTVLQGTFRPGENLTYVFRIKNTGTQALYHVTVKDNLGGSQEPLSYLQGTARLYVNQTELILTPTVGEGTLTFFLPDPLLSGQEAVIVYVAVVSETIDFQVNTIMNMAEVTANGGSAAGPQISAVPPPSAEIQREAYAQVSISKQPDKRIVAPGESLTYTFTLLNTGNQVALNVIIQDTLPAEFTVNEVRLLSGDASFIYAPGDYTIDSNNRITLPNASGTPITVPAADLEGPGMTIVTITGTVTQR